MTLTEDAGKKLPPLPPSFLPPCLKMKGNSVIILKRSSICYFIIFKKGHYA